MTEKQVWLITGAGRGLGADIASAALAAGHKVVATGRSVTKVAAALGGHDNLLAHELDVTRPPDAEAAVAAPSRRSAGSTSWSTMPATSLPASSRS
jgi:NAD(P)-dependent dehydrogenase (short-subunit alcohol dehydrogenase family)